MALDAMTGRSRNVVIANNDFVRKPGTVLTSPTSFVAGMGLANLTNDRLSMVCRTIGSSVILDLDMGYPVPASLIMLLGHNLTAAAKWRIRGANARSGTADAPGGYNFALADTVYDTRRGLKIGTARGAYTWTGTMLDHDFTSGTLPAGVTFSRPSIGTYCDYTGTLRTAAPGEPRFDYDPVTKAARGLLMEESRANLLLYSAADTTLPGWSIGANTSRIGTTTVPDGTVAAVYRNSSTGFAFISRTYDLAASTTYTVSCYARRVSGTGTGGSIISAAYHDGTTQQRAAAGMASVPADGAVVRVSVTFTNVTAGTYSAYFFADTGAVGDTAIWNVQCEAGASPTSYIPTAATIVTRAADVLTMPTSALPSFNASAGTLIAVGESAAADAPNRRIVSLHDGTINNRIDLGRIGSANQGWATVAASGTLQANLGTAPWPGGAVSSMGIAFQQDAVAAALNGAGAVTDTSGTVPAVNTVRLGDLTGAQPWCGWISRLTYIAARVSNADLQTLTNPATSAATRAATLAPYAGTSGTAPITLGTGTRIVYVDDTDMRLYPGAGVRLAINDAAYMSGTVIAYERPTGKLTVNVTAVVGSGSATTVSILREASDMPVWPSVEPFGLSYWGNFSWGGQIDLLGEGYQPPGVHMPGLANGDGQPVYARYLKIEVQDPSLAWLDIGRLVLAAAYQPTINMQWDWRIGWTDPSTRERSRGGQTYVNARRQWRTASLSLAGIGRSEMLSQMYELRRAVGVRLPFAVILDPTDPANLHRLTLWGSIPDQSVEYSNPQYRDYRTVLNIEEFF